MRIPYSEGGLIETKWIQFIVGGITTITMVVFKSINGKTKATKYLLKNSDIPREIVIPSRNSNTPLTENLIYQDEINNLYKETMKNLTVRLNKIKEGNILDIKIKANLEKIDELLKSKD